MIQPQSMVRIVDNSGVRRVKCFHCKGGSRVRNTFVGEEFKASVRGVRAMKKITKGDIVNAVLVKSSAPSIFKDGSSSFHKENGAIVVNDKGKILGTRIFGWVSRDLRKARLGKIVLICARKPL